MNDLGGKGARCGSRHAGCRHRFDCAADGRRVLSDLVHRLPALVAGILAAAVLLAACGNDTTSTAPDSDQSPRGAEVYAQSCASCHGVDLGGTERGPSHLSVVYEPNHHGDDAFRSAITNGAPQHHWSFGDMAPIEGLSADDVEAVIDFIRAEQQRRGFEQ